MTRIDRTDQLLDALRQQIVAKLETRSTAAAGSVDESGGSEAAGAMGIETLRRRLADELRPLDFGSPDGRRQARAAFIESILAWDFGDALLRDARLSRFVGTLDEAICADQAIATKLDQLLASLARGR